MINVQDNLDLLGLMVEDRTTKLKGVVTSISFDLYGCVQALVNPGVLPDGKLGECYWFDTSRLSVQTGPRVMSLPTFSFPKGPEAKPAKY